MRAAIGAAAAGVIFSLGLGLGGMTDPGRVVGFLDIAGAWDPSLAFVMAGALTSHLILRRLILRRRKPVFGSGFQLHLRSAIDRLLLLGAALFGVGWGLAGYCPGPAITSIASGSQNALLFVAAMGAGMAAFAAWERLVGARAPAPIPGDAGDRACLLFPAGSA